MLQYNNYYWLHTQEFAVRDSGTYRARMSNLNERESCVRNNTRSVTCTEWFRSSKSKGRKATRQEARAQQPTKVHDSPTSPLQFQAVKCCDSVIWRLSHVSFTCECKMGCTQTHPLTSGTHGELVECQSVLAAQNSWWVMKWSRRTGLLKFVNWDSLCVKVSDLLQSRLQIFLGCNKLPLLALLCIAFQEWGHAIVMICWFLLCGPKEEAHWWEIPSSIHDRGSHNKTHHENLEMSWLCGCTRLANPPFITAAGGAMVGRGISQMKLIVWVKPWEKKDALFWNTPNESNCCTDWEWWWSWSGLLWNGNNSMVAFIYNQWLPEQRRGNHGMLRGELESARAAGLSSCSFFHWHSLFWVFLLLCVVLPIVLPCIADSHPTDQGSLHLRRKETWNFNCSIFTQWRGMSYSLRMSHLFMHKTTRHIKNAGAVPSCSVPCTIRNPPHRKSWHLKKQMNENQGGHTFADLRHGNILLTSTATRIKQALLWASLIFKLLGKTIVPHGLAAGAVLSVDVNGD